VDHGADDGAFFAGVVCDTVDVICAPARLACCLYFGDERQPASAGLRGSHFEPQKLVFDACDLVDHVKRRCRQLRVESFRGRLRECEFFFLPPAYELVAFVGVLESLVEHEPEIVEFFHLFGDEYPGTECVDDACFGVEHRVSHPTDRVRTPQPMYAVYVCRVCIPKKNVVFPSLYGLSAACQPRRCTSCEEVRKSSIRGRRYR
jgi:hypothetical protein